MGLQNRQVVFIYVPVTSKYQLLAFVLENRSVFQGKYLLFLVEGRQIIPTKQRPGIGCKGVFFSAHFLAGWQKNRQLLASPYPLHPIPSFFRILCRPSTKKEVFSMETQVFQNIPTTKSGYLEVARVHG